MIPVFRPTTGDEEASAVREVLNSRWIGLGSITRTFEDEFARYLNARNAIATNSGTAALHLSLVAAGVKSGDEVILPALNFVSAAHVIMYCGAKPVFAEIEEDNLTLDPSDVEAKTNERTKTIIAVHYGGNLCDLQALSGICRSRSAVLIEDAAHACGAEYMGEKAGTLGIGCFSFHAVKNLATGDGGMITTKDKRTAERLRRLVWLGISHTTWDRYGKPSERRNWDYRVDEIGFKYHMNDVVAAIGRVQLKKLDESNRRRREIAKYYSDSLSSEEWIDLPQVRKGCVSSYHLFAIRAKKRDKLVSYLAKKGIATSVHYRPLYYFKPYRRFRLALPVTERTWRRLVSLPIYPEMTLDSQDKVVSAIKEFGRENKP